MAEVTQPDGREVDGGDLWPFFERYARAFESYAADAVTACYATPCLLIREGMTVTHESAESVAESVRALFDLHRAWDVQTAAPVEVVVHEATGGHVIARVDWRLGRRGSRVSWTFPTTYTLVPTTDGGWRIAVAVTHDAPF